MRATPDDIERRRWFTTRIGPESAPLEIHLYPCFGPRHKLAQCNCWCHPEIAPDGLIVVHNVSH